MKVILFFSGTIGLCLLSMFSCSNPSEQAVNEPVEKMEIVERKDTIVSFDPETMEESIQVVTSYDTIISFDAGQGE